MIESSRVVPNQVPTNSQVGFNIPVGADSSSRIYTIKTFELKTFPKSSMTSWITINYFNQIYNNIFSIYYRTRVGRVRVIISCIDLIIEIPVLGVLIYFLTQSEELPVFVFIATTIIALGFFIFTLIAHLADSIHPRQCIKYMSDCDAFAFLLYLVFAIMTMVFFASEQFALQIFIFSISLI